MPTSYIARPSKINLNLDFLFENIPSGNHGPKSSGTKKNVFNFVIEQKDEIILHLKKCFGELCTKSQTPTASPGTDVVIFKIFS
jgi:hypothetical protein